MQRDNIHFSRELHTIVSHVQFHKIFFVFYFYYFTEQYLRLLYTAAHRLVYIPLTLTIDFAFGV